MHESGSRAPDGIPASEGRPASSDSSQSDKDSLLLRGYLYPGEGTMPLHSRRTLDQYSYYMLKSTERRDRDQVVYRWVDKKRKEGELPSGTPTPILMVDQLWLWVLPDGMPRLDISSFTRLILSRNRHHKLAQHPQAIRAVQHQKASQ